MAQPRILLFDSGMGGLTVARAVAHQMPDAHLIYAADNAAFPYGAWKEKELVKRIVMVIGRLIELAQPDVVVVACNTASTIALAELRAVYAVPFVGTVPAIKPAAAQTRSNVIGVLATPGTVSREYTHSLIHTFAFHCKVFLHGAPRLAEIAEQKLRGHAIDMEELKREVAPVFRKRDGKQTDVVVLACTHYPLITAEIARVAPWAVTYIDPAPAIARRTADIVEETPLKVADANVPAHGTVVLTSARGSASETLAAYASMGFPQHRVIDLPA
ncbi:MAG: glutamate racemase [Proteobacteria bacterium]|nr:glutamate racemase [Pseudomonadota bacterium]